jgi:hypothetical protein
MPFRTLLQQPRTLYRIAAVCVILNFAIARLAPHHGGRWEDLTDAVQGALLGIAIPLMLIVVRMNRTGRCRSSASR